MDLFNSNSLAYQPLFSSSGASNPVAAYGSSIGSSSNLSPQVNVSPGAQTPNVPQVGGNSASTGLGFNVGTGQLALGGLQTIAGIWSAWESNKLSKQQFKYQKSVTEANMANQIKSYNTTLADRARSRVHTEGRPQSEADDYVEKNKMTRGTL